MILIADSGSTKTDWCVADQGKVLTCIQTAGMNPYLQTEETMGREIEQTLLPRLASTSIEAVYFYGAGCAFPEKNRMVEEAIRRYLPVPIEVDSDLLGAARALCGHQRGIACILGTGSNSCLYDGREIIQHVPPLGFILGDEGSGSALGRRLASDYLKGQLPKQLRELFFAAYRLDETAILEHVYRKPFPNRFLAGLSRFLAKHLNEPAVRKLVLQSFQNFLQRNVMQYEGCHELEIHFTGSIAYFYREILQEAVDSLQLRLGTVERTPMEGLVSYHSSPLYLYNNV